MAGRNKIAAEISRAMLVLFAALAFCLFATAFAQEQVEPQADSAAEEEGIDLSDAEAAARIREIFDEIDTLRAVTVRVRAGVVRLGGVAPSAAAAERAAELAAGVAGVVTVENAIERDVSVPSRLAPAIGGLEALAHNAVRLAPVLAVAIFIFAAIYFIGGRIARWNALWRRITPNLFVAELAAATTRVVFVILAAVAALSLLDATPLLGAVLGAAGVIGLAVGFGLRDIVENYIASVMLSARQPFGPDDHVSIDGREGRVVRLTPRATILRTLDGNQLRIPNATVFKAVIVNFSANPERRFEFEIALDVDRDPALAMRAGRKALEELDYVLKDPPPFSGFARMDVRLVLVFSAWIDQRQVDFAKSRARAAGAVKARLDETFAKQKESGKTAADDAPDVAPEAAMSRLVAEERRAAGEKDLLDPRPPAAE